MEEAAQIIQLAAPYISYLVPAIFIFSALATADLIFDFIVRIVKQARKEYRL